MMSGLEIKYELSPIQVGMYFDCQMGDPAAYNLSASFMFKNISESHFLNALEILVAEQEVLRACIQVVNDIPVLMVKDDVAFQLQQLDFSMRGDELSAWIKQELERPFDMSVCPLFRANLLKLSPNEHVLVFTMHHLIGDGASFNILLKKLLTYHNKLSKSQGVILKRDQGFLNFIESTHHELIQGTYAKQKEFWLQKMHDIKPTYFPTDYTPGSVSGLGLEHVFEISEELNLAIQVLAQENEVSSFTFFLAVFSLLLAQYTQEEEVVFASPFSYRSDSDVEDTIGCFIRLIILKFRIEKNISFAQFLQKVAKEFIDAYKNSDYPCSLAVSKKLSEDPATTASLFDINFVYDVYEEMSAENVHAEIIAQEAVTFPGHLMVILNKLPTKNVLKIQYKPDLFHKSSIEKLGTSFIRLLGAVVSDGTIKLNALPLITQSKVERPKQEKIQAEDDKNNLSTTLSSQIQDNITRIWKEVLSVSDIGLDDNFFDKGGSSLALIQVNNKLKKANMDLSIRAQFQLPTIRMLLNYFCKKDAVQPVVKTRVFTRSESKPISRDVAIIGVSINVPGAKSIDTFWQNLKEIKETIRYYEDKELLEMGIPKEVFQSPNYVKASGRIEGTEFFDPGFFDYAPADVQLMSPQYRLLYPGLWEAFEDAGYFPNSDPSVIGLFLSGSDDFEWYKEALLNQDNYSLKYQAFTLGTNHFLATRLAYKLDIKGPVFTALSGCSSALLTPHLACQSLLLQECDMAVAGGITLELPNKGGYFYEEGMMFSADGHCRPFDAQASGTFFSNGMALVVLKRLEDAVRDNDHIYAVIRGSAVNNDGAQKLGFTAPSVQGQVEAIQKAYRIAGIDPETVGYIEAHGTGTLLGDPIEIESLTQAFATPKKQYCILSSVKGNIGHPDTAAGAVGLVKVALSFEHNYIPATANYQTPNPEIDLNNSPFIIKAEGTPWVPSDSNQLLRAGINSFGVGGTNVHMVLEQAPIVSKVSPVSQTNLLVFSAKTKTALLNTSKRIVQYLHKNPKVNLSDAAWMLQIGRKEFAFRKTLTLQESFYHSSEEDVLKALEVESVQEVESTEKKIVFMFSGQGSQYAGMLKDIYFADEPYGIGRCVKKHLEKVLSLLPEDEAASLINIVFDEDNTHKINETQYSQLAIFTISYALAQALIELGIQPTALIGHSIGELTAATVAGVFDLKSALEIVKFRGRIMQQQPSGAMLAVLQDPNSIQEVLPSDVWLALKNATQNCVVGGSHDAIATFEKLCEEKEWVTASVKTSHAFHTPMMDKAAQEFYKKIASYTLSDPKIPIVSNLTGSWVKSGEMSAHDYWVNHILKPVNFSQGLAEVLKMEKGIFLEIGPGHVLSSFAKQHVGRVATQHVVNLMRHPNETEHDEIYLYNKIGQLWSLGVSIDWCAIKGKAHRYRVSLPTYVFDEDFFPIDIKIGSQTENLNTTKNSLVVSTPAPLNLDFKMGTNKSLEVITEAYKSVLGLKKIDPQDDFFALGGDSLKAIGITAFVYQVLSIKIDVKAIFNYAKPYELAEYINTLMPVDLSCKIQPAAICEHYPLSSAQKRMYTLHLLDKEGLAYNLPSATRIQGKLDKGRFECAIEHLIQRHEPLRTRFAIIENTPVQIVDPVGQLPITYLDHLDTDDAAIRRFIIQFIKPFDLQNGPVFRVQLITLGQDDYLFLCDIHHIVADGTSLEIMARDFNQLYSGDLATPKFQYKDYAVWQTQNRQSAVINEQKEFWLSHLNGELPVLSFPTDYARQAIKQTSGDRVYFTLDKELTTKLLQLAHATHTTMFMVLLSAWQIVLSRYSGQTDTIVGVPVAGRDLHETIDMIGMFVNILPIRNQANDDRMFSEFLASVKENVLNAFENQNYPFDELIQHLNIRRDLGRNVLFDACFDFQNMTLHDLYIDGNCRFTPIQVKANTAIYDLLLTCQEDKNKENITAYIEYSTALFKQTTIERIVANLQTLLLEITQNQDLLLGNIELVSQHEQEIICDLFNQTFLPISADDSIVNMFEHNVQRIPNSVALVLHDHKTYTYAELDVASSSIACCLNSMGVKENDVVGIIAQRDAILIIGLLGTLKVGAAFVLIDPMFPAERIAHIISQSDPKLILCSDRYKNQVVFEGPLLNLDTHDYTKSLDYISLSKDVKDSLAYIMFTSGSTGEPKGVMVNHASLVNFVCDIKSRGIFQASTDRIISVTTVSFDIFIFESLVPLCTGHSIYMANEEEQLDPALAAAKIITHQVTHMVSTVSRIKCFTEHVLFKTVLKQFKCIVSGGENFPISLLQEIQRLSKASVYNMYGPTETTIWSTTQDLTHAVVVNIGRPIANTQAYITNANGKLQPLGVYGELCLSGLGLAKGYLNNNEANSIKFTSMNHGSTVYKTGDIARFLETGDIELQGRLDTQIKVRGYRVELGEIENTVQRYEQVRLVSVIGWTDKNNTKQIVLYYCLKNKTDSEGSQERIKHWLEQKLPHYMMPALYIELADMPFLPNGKIDQNALPSPSTQKMSLPRFEESIVLSKMEKRLLLLWQEVLPAKQVGLQDNFFDLGGNSLSLIQINNKLFEEFGYAIPLLKFFQYPTISSFVKNISINTAEFKSKMPAMTHSNEAIQGQDVAVIGLSGKFPGADNLEQFWENVVTGTESLTYFEQKELLDTGIDLKILTDANYVRSKGFLENVEYFDAELFGYTNADADSMDPQIRLLHQCVWEALENAGYDPSSYAGSIGLFAGSSSNLLWMSSQLKDYQDFVNSFETILLNEKDFMTTRLSYKLNMKGPSVNVQTACSTSLVAIHQAAQAIINKECEMALAGGVSVTFPRKEGYLWHKGLIFSKDGHCKPFSNDASGIVPGNGCGIVLLKSLVNALQDGDHIYGVIKGSAINNDGINKIGFTAPSIEGQSQVIRAALDKAKVDVEQICYLEAHGTGTTLGDPIEIHALKKAWATERKNYCALGSVKANIGHLDAAAGVASFIKTTLALYNRTLPPLANFTQPNPDIDLANSPFYVSKFAQKIEDSARVLRAGLSSFGIGGTNAHLVMEQPPRYVEQLCSETIHILPFSGQTQQTLTDTSKKVIEHLKNNGAVRLSDAAWTLQVGRKTLEYRKVLVVQDDIQRDGNVIFSTMGDSVSSVRKEVVFYFSAACEQEKIRELYQSAEHSSISRLFKRALDIIVNTLPLEDQNCFKGLENNFTPLLHFAAGYALAKTCIDIGIIPKAVSGSGLGELIALTVANVFTIETVLEIIQHNLSLEQLFSETEKYPMQVSSVPLLSALTNEEQVSLLGTPIFMVFGIAQNVDTEIDPRLLDHVEPMYSLLSFNTHNPLHGLNSCLAKLWCLGHNIDWSILSVDPAKRRVPLPTYEFRKCYHKDDIVLSATAPEQKSFTKIPSPDKEKKQACLMDIWCRLFGRKVITADEDFFMLGGDSLKASILTANVQKQLGISMPLSVVFKHSRFEHMQDWLDSQIRATDYQSIDRLPKQDFYPVSSAQKRMYATHTLLAQSIPYNLAAVYTVEGNLDKDRLKNAFDSLVQRHEAFRTRFDIKTGEVVQIIEETLPSVVEFEDSAGCNFYSNILENIRPFNLTEAPLFRVKLITFSTTQHMLLVDLHHIIADQRSISILIREFADLYAGKRLIPLPLQYKDFAVWQNNLFETDSVKKKMMYWQHEFKDGIPILNMPTDYPRSRDRSYQGKRIAIDMTNTLQSKIERVAKEQALTPFMIFMGAFKLVLWKYTGQADCVIGTATAGRSHSDLLDIIGMFVSTLAIRSHIQDSWGVQDYLQHIKEKILLAYENQDCQFEKIVEVLNVEKGLSRNPVFDVAINYLDIEGNRELTLDNLVIKPVSDVPVYSKFDITWTIEKNADHYTADIEYASDLYKIETMQMFAKHLLHALAFIVDNRESKVTDFSLLTPIEKQHALESIDKIEKNYPDKTVSQLFSEQVEMYPERSAIVWENQELTYREFNQEINKIAALLRVKGIKQGERVAILLERSLSQMASIFAVLKCGCTYVPLDPKYPSARISLILTDSRPSFVITESRHALSDTVVFFSYVFLDKEDAFFNDINDVFSFEQSAPRSSSKDGAYIMYTSGSTGKPKGVLVSHKNIVQLVKNNNLIEFLPSDRVLQVSNYAFDGSVFDIFGALLNGACLVLLSEEKLIEMADLTAWIKQQKVSVFYIPTALFNVLVDWDVVALQDVRKILFGGESPSNRHVRKALNHLGSDRLIHIYGPTETTVFSTYYPVQQLEEGDVRLPIGFPLARTKLYVLDKQRKLLPPNIIGELYIGGDGVAQGYLNRNDLTQEKFISSPFRDHELLYRTGDLVKQLPTGELVFIGREDFQVKIRGFRVELKEVEECIKNIQGVSQALVTLQKDGHDHPYLAAYFTLSLAFKDKQQNYRPETVKAILSKQLPEYMIPARIKMLSSFPINLNGKIDLKALPEIDNLQHNCFPGHSDGQTTEQIILAEAQRILDNPGFTVKDNFFNNGGHSIKAIAFIHNLKQLGVSFKVSDIFQHPTVEELNALYSVVVQPNNESVSLAAPRVSLNLNQIDSVVDYFRGAWKTLSNMTSSGRLLSSFAFAPIQVLHSKQSKRFSGFSMPIYGPITEDKIRQVLLQIIKKNQLLHCIPQIGQSMWYEYDISDLSGLIVKNLGYADLSQYMQSTQTYIVQALSVATLSASYAEGELPWRCSCLRLNHNMHQLIWGFDHVAFDGMSAEILRSQVDNILTSRNIEPVESYRDYAHFLLQGPQNASEEDIITKFNLRKWSEHNEVIIQKLRSKTQKRVDINIEIAIQEQNITDLWQFTFDLVLVLLKAYFGSQQIPLGVIHYGRSYQDRSFYNCVGEFLDVLPVIDETFDSDTVVPDLIGYCQKYALNFIALLLDPAISNKFPKISQLLASSFMTKDNRLKMLGFNFQGFVAKEERKLLAEATQHVSNTPISEFLIVAYYDETHLHISFPCYKKERAEILNTIKTYLTKKDEEVDYV